MCSTNTHAATNRRLIYIIVWTYISVGCVHTAICKCNEIYRLNIDSEKRETCAHGDWFRSFSIRTCFSAAQPRPHHNRISDISDDVLRPRIKFRAKYDYPTTHTRVYIYSLSFEVLLRFLCVYIFYDICLNVANANARYADLCDF